MNARIVALPTIACLNLRSCGGRVYALLGGLENISIRELREAAEADGKLRSVDAMHIMLRRLDSRLAGYGLGIARLVGNQTYRLVPR